MTGLVSAALEKQFIEGDRLCAGFHLMGWVFALLLGCVAGQLLTDASESISEAIWNSKWYQADARLKKDVLFLLARSQKNFFITVGPFGILSLDLFVKKMTPDSNKIIVCRTTRRNMSLGLLWPEKNDELVYGKRYFIKIFIYSLITITNLGISWTHFYVGLKNQNSKFSEDVAVMLSITGTTYMVFIYVKNQPKVALLLRDLSTFHYFGMPPDFEQQEKILNVLSNVTFAYAMVAALLYNLVRLYQKPECEEMKMEKEICGFIVPVWLHFEMDYFPFYELGFFYMYASTVLILKSALVIPFHAFEISQHIILRIKHLNTIIVKCLDGDYDYCRKNLQKCIHYHREIIEFATRLDSYFSTCMFSHLTITAAVCACIEKQFVEVEINSEYKVERDVSEEMAVLSAIYGTYFMVFAYIKNQKKIVSLLRDLSSFDKFGIPEDFHEEEKKLTFYAKFIYAYVTITVSAYNFLLLFLKSDCEKYNKEHDLKENCGLVIPTPFAADYFPVFQLVFLYQLVVSNMLLPLSMIIAYNTFEITQHIIFRINHLNIMTTACFDDDDYQTSRNKLTRCILYHSEVLDFAKRVDDCFSSCMFAHLILTSTICACLEKQITVGINRIGGVLHILGWIVNLFVSCLAGQRLINANGTIAEAIWASKWYQADVRLQKDVRLMLLRSQRDLHLRAGPFGIVSFALFVSALASIQ
ncbi:hypothetical protein GEV33_011663 [Tenebrio molitor]|uniref:Uncharacterized protein n=1 Tax=Tenebrio molitor TaxID=7067 RepID=A0A8J6HBP1_TENMO|nr:hypothetical protein GEV33_011663 [Tenebrio molitor]